MAEGKSNSQDLGRERDVMNNPLADNSLQAILNSFYQLLQEYLMGLESNSIITLVQ